jgi:MSHA biogenesis protein MshO
MVELVVTIVIIGILASLGGMFISRPMEGYVDMKRRAELVDQAEMSLRRMQRDIRAALPNSIRTFNGGKGVEMLHVVDGGRYRRLPDDDGNGDVLKFNKADDKFEVLGGLMPSDERDYVPNKCFCVIYNLNNSDCSDPNPDIANAYALTPCDSSFDKKNIVGIDSIVIVDSNNDGTNDATQVVLDSPIKFPYPSPYQRFFIVDEAISYKIEGNPTVGYRLWRYSGYEINNCPDPSELTEEYRALVAKFIDEANSSFDYSSATSTRSGLVTMRLTLEDNEESISLLHQVHVDNAP